MLGQVLGTNGNVPLERVLVYSEMTNVNLRLAVSIYLRYLPSYDFDEHQSGLC